MAATSHSASIARTLPAPSTPAAEGRVGLADAQLGRLGLERGELTGLCGGRTLP